MDWVLQPPPPLYPSKSSSFSFNRVSPSILLIIIILAIIFFISGLLHLLVKFLLKPPNRDSNEINNLTALEGQLQQLFHLHDAGVDQSFIDTLPIFNYKAIIGLKHPFDCPVCLCEFEPEDELRLLPKCSHAFHMECIDTWLLSHSTCPLCRANLLPDFPQNTNFSPVVMVLESETEIVSDAEAGSDDFRVPHEDQKVEKCGEISEKVVLVKLGKYRNVGGENEGSDEINAEARRCFSMGSFAYIMDENSLKVPIKLTTKKQFSKKLHRPAMSECGSDSRRELNFFEAIRVSETQIGGNENKSISRDSFSVSKIWLSEKKDKPNAATIQSSRRAFSFRFPTHRNPVAAGEINTKNDRRSPSEIEDEEMQRSNSLDSAGDCPSLGRRSLLWTIGLQNKVVHSSFSSNV